MELQDFIGLPLSLAMERLQKEKIAYSIVSNGEHKIQYDTVLVVNAMLLPDKTVRLITDRFLLNR